MSGRYAPYNIFSDWVQQSALAVQNNCYLVHNKLWQDREQLYIDTAKKYTKKELENFAQMFIWLGDALTEDLTDVLGQVYMESGMGKKRDNCKREEKGNGHIGSSRHDCESGSCKTHSKQETRLDELHGCRNEPGVHHNDFFVER